jgi:hypothetical protein
MAVRELVAMAGLAVTVPFWVAMAAMRARLLRPSLRTSQMVALPQPPQRLLVPLLLALVVVAVKVVRHLQPLPLTVAPVVKHRFLAMAVMVVRVVPAERVRVVPVEPAALQPAAPAATLRLRVTKRSALDPTASW